MTQVIIDRHNVTLEYATDCMIVRSGDDLPRTLPLKHLDKVVCMHNVQLTTQLIGQLYKRGIDLIVLNARYEKHSFALYADQQKQVGRRCRQYHWQQDNGSRLQLALELCRHKFRVALQQINVLKAPEEVWRAANMQICFALHQLAICQNEDQLRGIEGNAQRVLFEFWRSLLPAGLGFERRQRRPPKDPVNATLSFAYTLVHQEAVRQAKRFALDPQLGFYHRVAFGRQSLACDLMEPVRPIIERWVISLFCDGVLNKRMFSSTKEGCLLGKSGRARFYDAYDAFYTEWHRHLAAAARWSAKK